MKSKIKTLVELLEDDDVETSAHVMSEILSSDRTAWRIIGRLQESSSGIIRKKAHQMQFAANSRARRRKLATRLSEQNLNLIKGLIELHLQWFDEDSEDFVMEEWDRFKNFSGNWCPNSIENLSEMMSSLGMESSEFDELECVDYCIGEVTSTGRGADFMLCIVARILARDAGWNPSIVATDAGFCVYNERTKTGLFPAKKWAMAKCEISNNVRRWSDLMLLNLAANSMLFCSIAGGQLRYSYMIGACIAESIGKKPSEILPYPLGGSVDFPEKPSKNNTR
ncbi:MAG TPA: hypothetical protein PK821_02360 [Victivallales bacterium]|nr:hypothetical protein [Victivallales bacterium]